MQISIADSGTVQIEEDGKSLASELAVRSRSLDWSGIAESLPDPDPVLRNLGQDMRVYRELLADAHVGSCYISRKSGTLSCEWDIREAAGGAVRTSRKAAELIKSVMDDLDVYQVISDILEAPFFGMAPVEVTWQAGKKWLPAKVEGKPPEWFVFDDDNRLRFLSQQNMIQGELLPPYKFLLPRHFASYRNPYGDRLLSRCFWPVAFKRGGFKFWAVFTEKFGMPWVVGKVPRGTGDTERSRVLSSLVQMVQDAVAVINDDESIELKESAFKASSAGIYENLISAANREVSKAILGQTLTTELDKGGSFAATKEHMEVRADLIDQDKRMVADAFNQLFAWIVDFNLPGAAPPGFVFFEEENIQADRASRDEKLYKQGVRFEPQYYQRAYNLEEGEFTLHQKEPPKGGNPQPSEFADSVKKNAGKKYAATQKKIDDLADKAIADALPLFEKFARKVKQFLDAVNTLGQARDGIIGLWDDLDPGALSTQLAGALQAADRIGAKSVGGGAGAFAEASRGKGKPFAEAADYFKARAFTIAGVTKADLLSEVKDELSRAMTEGVSLEDFRTSAQEMFERHGYSGISAYRIDTVFRTNLQGAYQAGRYRQMTRPHVLKARPFWRYLAVLDASTRPTHAALHGKVFSHDDPFWQTWYPPNGFNCRCTVQTVSPRELARRGWKAETEDPTGSLIEPVDPVTGDTLAARPLIPDRGWGARPATLQGLLSDKKARKELGAIAWREKKGQPGPRGLGRPVESRIPARFFAPAPQRLPRLDTRMKQGLSESDAFISIEREYKELMGITAAETMGVLKGPDGEILKVDINSLAHAMLDRNNARERFLRYFREVIEDPYEILLTEYETPGRKKTKLRKKYIGLFKGEKREGLVIVAEVSPEGWVMWNVMNAKKKTIDRQRRAVKVLYGK